MQSTLDPGPLHPGSTTMAHDEAADRQAIRELLDNWVVWRDSGAWERLRPLWHPGGRMIATWTEGTGDEFIAMSQAAWAKGFSSVHQHGATSIDVRGDRAVSQTKMKISQRSEVEGVLCDVVCTGRFYDFLERRDGRWGIMLRQPIYEKDRLDAVTPGAVPVLDAGLLEQFPVGYRYLAYLQTRMGYAVKRSLPGLRGPEVEALYRQGAVWLEGAPVDTGAWIGAAG